jgi:hypothetical protein
MRCDIDVPSATLRTQVSPTLVYESYMPIQVSFLTFVSCNDRLVICFVITQDSCLISRRLHTHPSFVSYIRCSNVSVWKLHTHPSFVSYIHETIAPDGTGRYGNSSHVHSRFAHVHSTYNLTRDCIFFLNAVVHFLPV